MFLLKPINNFQFALRNRSVRNRNNFIFRVGLENDCYAFFSNVKVSIQYTTVDLIRRWKFCPESFCVCINIIASNLCIHVHVCLIHNSLWCKNERVEKKWNETKRKQLRLIDSCNTNTLIYQNVNTHFPFLTQINGKKEGNKTRIFYRYVKWIDWKPNK